MCGAGGATKTFTGRPRSYQKKLIELCATKVSISIISMAVVQLLGSPPDVVVV